MIAVDLSGQDFIGLGFDICGNVREGIFISSILASGPARDSGLVHRGDRIKCLNISFEGVTLEDARDILNCGAPYKLRLLLEKGKESARYLKPNSKQNSNKSSLTNSIIGPFASKRSRSKTMNFLTENNNNNNNNINNNNINGSGPKSIGSNFNATKSYIKTKLSNLVSPSLSRDASHHQQDKKQTAESYQSSNVSQDVRTSPNNNETIITTSRSDSELKSSYSASNTTRDLQQPGQGSLANKRHLSSGEGNSNLSTVGTTPDNI